MKESEGQTGTGKIWGKKGLKLRLFSQSAKAIYNCLTCNVLKENSTEKDSA